MSIISTGTTLTTGLVLTSDTNGELIIKTGASAVTAATFSSGGTATLSNVAITSLTVSSPSVFPAGSASAPAVTTTGDTDTGIYFPAANQVAVTTGGTVAAAFNSNGLFFRNRIINGDMRIDQRNAGASVAVAAGASAFPTDRFELANNTDGAASGQQDSSVPSGFANSIKVTTTTADATLTTNQNLQFYQRIEGTNIADLGWGAAGALTVTLSFWVRSSLTGTFGASIRNGAFDRSYPFSYTISSANTWEYKTVTIPGDTTGTWLTTTGIGMLVTFGLGAGPDRSGTAGAWAASNLIAPTGATSLIGTLNATWYVTGVQLETGSVATPFERRPYGTELMLCQRYYEKSYNIATVPGTATTSDYYQMTPLNPSVTNYYSAVAVIFSVSKRAAPTMSYWDLAGNASRITNFDAGNLNRTNNTNTVTSFSGYEKMATMVNVQTNGTLSGFHWVAASEL